MTAHSVDHVEFFVGDVNQASHYYCGTYGFRVVAEAGPLTGLAGARSLVLAHGGVRLVLTSALHADHAASRFVRRHGDGVRDVALRSTDAVGDFERAVTAGAYAVAEPETFEDERGRVIRATIAATNDLVHSFVQRDGPAWTPSAGTCSTVPPNSYPLPRPRQGKSTPTTGKRHDDERRTL